MIGWKSSSNKSIGSTLSLFFSVPITADLISAQNDHVPTDLTKAACCAPPGFLLSFFFSCTIGSGQALSQIAIENGSKNQSISTHTSYTIENHRLAAHPTRRDAKHANSQLAINSTAP
jgi:hypothetical protein